MSCEHEYLDYDERIDEHYIQCEDCQVILIIEWEECCCGWHWYAVEKADCQVPWWNQESIKEVRE